MRSILLFVALVLPGYALFAQYTYTIKADSVMFTSCDSSEFILLNHTQGVPGFLFNTGNGRTAFQRPLTKLSDTAYLVGQDTLKLPSPYAWLQGGNSWGTTGIIGTFDNHHFDFYTNHTDQMRLDSAGDLLIGTTVTTYPYKLDVAGQARVKNVFDVTSGVGYDVITESDAPNYFGTGINASYVSLGGPIVATNLATFGSIPVNSMLFGGASPGNYNAIIDYGRNPVVAAIYGGGTIINGGWGGIDSGGARGNGINAIGLPLYLNGGRGTGAGTPGDVIIQTGSTAGSGNTIHSLATRWVVKGATGYLSNNTTPTSMVDITGAAGYSQLRIRTEYTPTSSSDPNGNPGDIAVDDNYIYYKTSTGWKRSALSTF
jgi:hypothetical protein